MSCERIATLQSGGCRAPRLRLRSSASSRDYQLCFQAFLSPPPHIIIPPLRRVHPLFPLPGFGANPVPSAISGAGASPPRRRHQGRSPGTRDPISQQKHLNVTCTKKVAYWSKMRGILNPLGISQMQIQWWKEKGSIKTRGLTIRL